MRVRLFIILLVVAIFHGSAVSSQAQGGTGSDALFAPFDALYTAGVLDAQATLLHLKDPPAAPKLQDITADNPDLVWKGAPGASPVLVTSFTRSLYYQSYSPGQSFNAGVDLWVVPAPQMKSEIRAEDPLGAALAPKLAVSEYLGLPPNNKNDAVVSVWVSPANMVRPAIDPRTDTHELETSFFLTGQTVPLTPAPTVPTEGGSPNYPSWFLNREATIFQLGTPSTPYPWTGLGYTYDWNPAAPDVVGGSEFVVPKGSPVVFQDLTPVGNYLK